jgi:DNA-binding response OmpR family regulator
MRFADSIDQMRSRFETHLASLRIAIISTCDRHEALRNAWLACNGVSNEYFRHCGDSDDNELEEFIRGAEIIIFSSNDIVTTERVFKKYKDNFRQSIIICVANKMSPSHRARLLKIGFDDVTDIAKIHGDEFIARCSSMQLRAKMARQSHAERAEIELKINAIADEGKINRRHKAILVSLLSSKNNTVSYESLRESLSLTYEPISLTQMKVLVCQLRKALRPGVQITSLAWLRLPGKGYKLLINNQFSNLGVQDGHSAIDRH